MLKKFAELPPRKRVGILGIILGIFAIFAGSPFDKAKTNVNIKEMSLINTEEIVNVTVDKLADDIIKSKYDYRLIDLRESSDYLKYNIPTSENFSVANILNSDLMRNENIILYSDNDIEAAQAWFLLKANDYNSISILEGGMNRWKEEILFPACNCGENPTVEQLHKHDQKTEVSKFFGGYMQTGSIVKKERELDMPELQAPAKIKLKKAEGKRKREGC
jgi:rhodanese-related sulfurtransferase